MDFRKILPFAAMIAAIAIYSMFFDILIPNMQGSDSYRTQVGAFFIVPIILLVVGQSGLAAGRTLLIDDLSANVEGARAVGMLGLQFTDVDQVRQELTKLGVPTI